MKGRVLLVCVSVCVCVCLCVCVSSLGPISPTQAGRRLNRRTLSPMHDITPCCLGDGYPVRERGRSLGVVGEGQGAFVTVTHTYSDECVCVCV